MRRRLAFLLKAVVSVGLVAALVVMLDPAALWQRARGLDPLWGLAALGLGFGQVAICALRWGAVLHALGLHLPARGVLALTHVGMAFSQALPTTVGGDAVRMWLAHRKGLGPGPAVTSVALERLVTLLALVLLVALAQPVLLPALNDARGIVLVRLIAVAGVAGVALVCVLDRLPAAWRRFRAVQGLVGLAAGARRLFLHPGRAALVLGVSVLGFVNLSLLAWALGRGLAAGVSAADCLVLVPPVILVSNAPVSIAGWGVREGAMVAALGMVGTPAPVALLLSLLYGAVTVLAALPGGLVWLAVRTEKVAESGAAS